MFYPKHAHPSLSFPGKGSSSLSGAWAQTLETILTVLSPILLSVHQQSLLVVSSKYQNIQNLNDISLLLVSPLPSSFLWFIAISFLNGLPASALAPYS